MKRLKAQLIQFIANPLTTNIATFFFLLIIALALIMSSGMFERAPKDCATIFFDVGSQSLGNIKSEMLVTEGAFELDKRTMNYKNIESQITDFERVASNTNSPNATFQPGSVITAKASIRWTGSEGDYTLPLSEITLTSPKSNPLSASNAIDQLKKFHQQSKLEFISSAQKHLMLSESHNHSCIMLRNLGNSPN